MAKVIKNLPPPHNWTKNDNIIYNCLVTCCNQMFTPIFRRLSDFSRSLHMFLRKCRYERMHTKMYKVDFIGPGFQTFFGFGHIKNQETQIRATLSSLIWVISFLF